ncbi:MAG: hypothetical protein KGY61_02285 [Desulfobacterales bacterium]|nr:hypothetical protein [Desulfobacterales bacterium]
MIPRHKKRICQLTAVLAAVMFLFGAAPAMGGDCLDLADVPLRSLRTLTPPGLIMFIFDNSGSMDWETMTQTLGKDATLCDDSDAGFYLNLDQKYYGYQYIFDTTGLGGSDNILETDGSARDKFLWLARWHGYNKVYYNPTVDYQPWPKWVELANADQSELNHPNKEQPDTPDATTNGENAHPDQPRIHPMYNKYTYDLTQDFASITLVDKCATETETIFVDDVNSNNETGDTFSATHETAGDSTWGTSSSGDAYPAMGDPNTSSSTYHYSYVDRYEKNVDFTATWETTNLDPTKEYHVYATWRGELYNRTTDVEYVVYDGSVSNQTDVASRSVNQRYTSGQWVQLTSSSGPITFSGSTGIVQFEHTQNYNINETYYDERVCADAVKFVEVPPDAGTATIQQRHYYIVENGTPYLINLNGSDFEYYKVCDNNDNKIVEDGDLVQLTEEEASTAGIIPDCTYADAEQNFANWFSFYRKRDYTARYAVSQVITQMSNVLFGFSTIPEREDLGVRWIDTHFDGKDFDNTNELLNRVYMLSDPNSGTPLRKGMNKVGKYFQELGGTFANTADVNALGIYSDKGTTYPYFTAEYGGECQQAFTIMMTDGAYNGQGPNIPNADGDNNTAFDGGKYADTQQDTLADGAMEFYETDLKTNLEDLVPTNPADDNKQQHMVTYTLSYGVHGTEDPADYPDCIGLECEGSGCCPEPWPTVTKGSLTTLDDLYHAAVNGRGLYLNASNPPELVEALLRIKADIESRLGSAAAVATNSVQRRAGSKVYQAKYLEGWMGNLIAFNVKVGTGTIGEKVWEAKEVLKSTDWDSGRTIFTFGTTNGGSAFRYTSLSDVQKAKLQNGLDYAFGTGQAPTVEELVPYLRGNHAQEKKNGGIARNRDGKLGDLVHSTPFYHDGVVYVGANDGMLHAFDSESGEEHFAYVPGRVYDHLAELADPEYEHRFFVDGPPYVADVSSTQTLLAGGFGKGAKGVYCLDVSGAKGADEANASDFTMWEYDGTSESSPSDLGYVYGKAYIIQTTDGWKVVFGNGYNSESEEAVLYLVDAKGGPTAGVTKIETGVTGCNGMSSPAVVDYQTDGIIDAIYAGDLKGNLWKFDISGDKAEWGSAYTDGTNPKPLFTAQSASGGTQPITSEPDVMYHCQSEKSGYIVVFGTGSYLNEDDLSDTSQQTMYGVWDWKKELEARGDISNPEQQYLGAFSTGSPRVLTNIDGASYLNGNPPTLQEQTIDYEDADKLILSDNEVYYFGTAEPSTGETQLGWYFDLPHSGERVVEDPMIRWDTAVFVGMWPECDYCDLGGGSSVLYQVDACNGGQTEEARFDADGDDVVDQYDMVHPDNPDVTFNPDEDYDGDGDTGDEDDIIAFLEMYGDGTTDYDADDLATVSGQAYGDIVRPTQLPPDRLAINPSTGAPPNTTPVVKIGSGFIYWRMIE